MNGLMNNEPTMEPVALEPALVRYAGDISALRPRSLAMSILLALSSAPKVMFSLPIDIFMMNSF